MGYRYSTFFYVLLLLSSFLLLNILSSSYAQQNGNLMPIFAEESTLDISLIFDIKKLNKDKYKEEYQPASLIYQREKNEPVYDTVPLKVRARGNSRKRICQFPPLRLNFAPKKTPDGLFSGLDKIKLVSYCKDSEQYEQYILKEYYTYKLYEHFSDKTFKTRLLRVTYIDSKGKRKPVTRYGFIIEADELVADRLSSHLYETAQMHPDNCDKEATTTLAVFQYMIGNTDWSIAKQHNVKLFVPKKTSNEAKPFAVPYDFDYSGLVDAHYAIPNEKLPVETIKERYYLGFCCEDATMKLVLSKFKDKKEAVFGVFNESSLLKEREKKEALRYIATFYEQLDKPELIASLLSKQCK